MDVHSLSTYWEFNAFVDNLFITSIFLNNSVGNISISKDPQVEIYFSYTRKYFRVFLNTLKSASKTISKFITCRELGKKWKFSFYHFFILTIFYAKMLSRMSKFFDFWLDPFLHRMSHVWINNNLYIIYIDIYVHEYIKASGTWHEERVKRASFRCHVVN